MLLKANGQTLRINYCAELDELKRIVKRPHLCSSCCAVCVGGRNLKNSLIRNAIKSNDGLYVIDCLGYKKNEKEYNTNCLNNEENNYSSSLEASLVHPLIKSVFR